MRRPSLPIVWCLSSQFSLTACLSALTLSHLAKSLAASATFCAPRFSGDCLGNLRIVEQGYDEGGYNATLCGIKVSGSASPASIDWDGDADLDLVVGDADGRLHYYERVGPGAVTEHIGIANPFDQVDVQLNAVPAFVDWDGDGDDDLVVGNGVGELEYFERTSANGFTRRSGTFAGFGCINSVAVPAFSDWDEDGDLDLILGACGGSLWYYERLSASVLSLRLGPNQDPLDGLSVGGWGAHPVVVDWDGDGDADLIVGDVFGNVHYFERMEDQRLVPRPGDANPFHNVTAGDFANQAALLVVDWDGDGVLEIIVGTTSGELHHYRHEAADNLVRRTGAGNNPFEDVRVPIYAIPVIVDWDGDGYLDLLLGSASSLQYYAGLADGNLVFNSSFFNGTSFNLAAPTVVDWDLDGDLDLVVGEDSGTLRYFERDAIGALVERRGDENPFRSISLPAAANPTFVDWDSDSDPDLVVGYHSGLLYFERLAEDSLVERTGTTNPFQAVNVISNARPAFVDWDGDGDDDLVVGGYSGKLAYFERLTADSVTERIGARNPFGVIDVGELMAAPAFADWDGDNDTDVVIGNFLGHLQFFVRGFCSQGTPCSYRGVCNGVLGSCACVTGYTMLDCSRCDAGYHTLERKFPPSCMECAGDERGTCAGRGTCLDDDFARANQQLSRSAAMVAIGTGSCSCSEPYFNGTDGFSRSTCSEGSCPPGFQESPLEDGLNGCDRCPPGSVSVRVSVQSWSVSQCTLCEAGKYASLNSGCLDCAEGTYSKAGRAECSFCEGGSVPSADKSSCEICPAGTSAARGNASCTPCQSGAFAVRGSASCQTCAGGSVPNANQTACRSCDAGYHVPLNSSECEPCLAGRYAAGEGSDRCEPCELGRYSGAGSASCMTCDQGLIPSLDGSSECEPCVAGKYAGKGSDRCKPCELGRYSGAGSATCIICDEGWIPSLDGSQCAACGVGSHASSGQSICSLDVTYMSLVAICMAAQHLGLFALVWNLRRQIRIVDVSQLGDKVVITTFHPHGLQLRHGQRTKVVLAGTRHYLLDKDEAVLVRDFDPMRLELLTAQGEPMLDQVDSSTGSLTLVFPNGLVHTGMLGVPSVVLAAVFLPVPWLSLSAAHTFNVFSRRADPALLQLVLVLAIAVVTFANIFAAFLGRRRRARTPTPLQRRLADFRARLLSRNPNPQRCERGPDRAVSVETLTELLNTFSDFIQGRTAYYLDPNITKPLTSRRKLSFAELAGPRRLVYFVSHFWGTEFRHFVGTIQKHAKVFSGSSGLEHMAYWICFLSNNQWRVSEEVGNGDWQESSFFKALRSGSCKATCMVLDAKALPLTRSWCLFEVLQTYRLLHEGTQPDFEGLLYCTNEGVLGSEKDVCFDVSVALAQRLGTLSLADATASNKGDQEMISNLVEKEGGMEHMNDFVRSNMSNTLNKVQKQFVEEMDVLRSRLDLGKPGHELSDSRSQEASSPTESEDVVSLPGMVSVVPQP